MAFVNLNIWSILLSAISAMILGGLWYGPLFGKSWMKMMGFTEKNMKSMPLTPMQSMILGFIAALVISTAIGSLINWASDRTIISSIKVALFVWFGFLVPVIIDSFLWEGKQFKLFLFNASYRLTSLIIMAIIFASMN